MRHRHPPHWRSDGNLHEPLFSCTVIWLICDLFDEDDTATPAAIGIRAASDESFPHLGHAKGEVQ